MKPEKLPELKSKVNERGVPSRATDTPRRFFEWWEGIEPLTQEPPKDDPSDRASSK